MADGYLESHYAEYEKRKEAWLKKKKHLSTINSKKQYYGRTTSTDPS